MTRRWILYLKTKGLGTLLFVLFSVFNYRFMVRPHVHENDIPIYVQLEPIVRESLAFESLNYFTCKRLIQSNEEFPKACVDYFREFFAHFNGIASQRSRPMKFLTLFSALNERILLNALKSVSIKYLRNGMQSEREEVNRLMARFIIKNSFLKFVSK